jgi:hypothetical protein
MAAHPKKANQQSDALCAWLCKLTHSRHASKKQQSMISRHRLTQHKICHSKQHR